MTLTEIYDECRALNNHYGNRFYHAIHLFPKNIQPHIHGLCAFDRVLLEMIHHPNEGADQEAVKEAMLAWQSAFEDGMNDTPSGNHYIQALVHSSKAFALSPDLINQLISARLKECTTNVFKTKRAFNTHLNKTAGTIAELFSGILELRDEKQKKQIKELAIAGELLELTLNFKQALDRGRCYFPQSDLKKFKYTQQSLQQKKCTKACKQLLKSYVDLAQTKIDTFNTQLEHFPARHQQGLGEVAQAYTSIAEHIRACDYDVLTQQLKFNFKFLLKQKSPLLARIWS